jgi:type IV pilus assembly protein PilQ
MRTDNVSNRRFTVGSVGLGALLGLWALIAPQWALAANTLQDISYSAISGNKLQIVLTTAAPAAEPLSFTTDNPARIALDFADTQSGLSSKNIAVGVGMVRSISAVEAGDRTRVVVNLVDSAPHSIETAGNQVILTVGADGGSAPAPVEAAPATVAATPPPAPVRASAPADTRSFTAATSPGSRSRDLRGVDFRRGDRGAGRIVLKLPSANTVVDTRLEGGNIVVDVKGTGVSSELAKIYDVGDFGTPVKSMTVRRSGQNTQVVIKASGNYDHVAYQADDVYTVEFRPLSVAEQEKKQLQKRVYAGERLSLNFQDIEVRSVLQLLADFTGKNMVVSDTVSGRITLRLKNVPWDQALDIILKTKGLSMRENDNVILVAPTEEIAAREKLELESTRQVEDLTPLRSDLIRMNFAKAADIAALLKASENKLLSGRGNVTVDERTNTLLVQDIPAKLEEVRELIQRLDIPMRQVMIESRVVIANNDFTRDLGVRFGLTKRGSAGDGSYVVGGTLPDSGFQTGETETGADPGNLLDGLMVNLPKVTGAGRGGSLGLLIGTVGSYLVGLELTAMQQEGKGELISMPKVITADQSKAVIKQGIEVPYQSATSSGATSVSFKEAVLKLEVTPQITPDDRIIMDLTITKDRPDFTRSVLGTPPLEKREIQTNVLVNNGETVVLGGILEDEKSQNQEKVPVLGDVPFVGFLFKQELNKNLSNELLFFITPRILKESLTLR